MTTATSTPQTTVGYVTLVRGNGNFRYLWFGQIISLLGDWFNLIASASLIALLTQSGAAIGGLFVVRMLAPFLVSPAAGVVADRYNRKTILILTDLSRAGAVLGFLLIQDASQIWLLYLLTAVQMGLSGFFFPARNAILPDIVEPAELGAANALSSATWSVMLAIGAAIGGLVSGTWGIYPAFIIDALTFLVSALFIGQISYRPGQKMKDQNQTVTAALGQYLEGLRYLRRHVDILFIALHKGANAVLVSGGFHVVVVSLAEDKFMVGKGGGISLGLLFGVTGIGTGLGPIIARRFTGDRDRALRYAISVSYLLTAGGLLLAAPLANFGLVLVGATLRGVGGGLGWVFSTQLLLQLVPSQIRGRVFATEFAFLTLMSAAGAAMTGRLIDTPLGISGVLGWMAGLILIPSMLWTAWLVFDQLQVPDPEETRSN